MTYITHTLTAALVATGLMSTVGCKHSRVTIVTPHRPRVAVVTSERYRPVPPVIVHRPAPVYHRPAPVIVRPPVCPPPVHYPEPLIVRPGGCTTGQVIVSAPRPVIIHRPAPRPVIVHRPPVHRPAPVVVHRPAPRPVIVVNKPSHHKPTHRTPTPVVRSHDRGRGDSRKAPHATQHRPSVIASKLSHRKPVAIAVTHRTSTRPTTTRTASTQRTVTSQWPRQDGNGRVRR